MPTTISRLDAVAPRLGYGRAALSVASSLLSVVPSARSFRAAPTGARVASSAPMGVLDVELDAFVSAPVDDLVAELHRIHGAADSTDAFVLPA